MPVSTAKRGTRSPIGKTAPQIVKKTLPRAKLTQIKDAFLENARLRTLIENAQRALIENDERMLQLTSASTPDGEQSARADGSKRAARKQSAAKKVGTGTRRARLGLPYRRSREEHLALDAVRPLTRNVRQVHGQEPESTSLLDALCDVFHESLLVLLTPKALILLSMVSRKGRELVDDCPKNISTSLW